MGARQSWPEDGSSPLQSIVPALPILGFGSAFAVSKLLAVSDAPAHAALGAIPLILIAVTYFGSLAAFGYGWTRGFPRWSMPFIGISILFTWYWSNVSTPGLIFGREVWGWRAWLPLVFVSGVCYFRAYGKVDWTVLRRRLRTEWSLPLFTVYGPSFMMIAVILDEVSSPLAVPAVLTGTAILGAGAIVYMLAASERLRALSLGAAAGLAAISTGLFSAMYWDGRQEYWMSSPAAGMATFARTTAWSLVILIGAGGLALGVAQILARLRFDRIGSAQHS